MSLERLSAVESVEHADRLDWMEACKLANEVDANRTIRATKFFGIDFETFVEVADKLPEHCEDMPTKLGRINPDSVLAQCNAIADSWVKSEVRLLGIRSPKKYAKTHDRGGGIVNARNEDSFGGKLAKLKKLGKKLIFRSNWHVPIGMFFLFFLIETESQYH